MQLASYAVLAKELISQDISPVSIELYDTLEAEAVKRYAPYITRQFQSQTFHDTRFQTRVNDAGELWKFIDSQQDARFEENIVKFLSKRLTAQEYDLFKYLTAKTVEYCKIHGFEPVSGRNAISRALIVIRTIVQFVPPGATVLEVGPGSGYVTAALVKLGYKVVCYDVTQSLFLHQSSFWRFLFGDQYNCCIDSDSKIDLVNHSLCHVPWWNFVDMNFALPAIDVLTVNHALNEMPPLSVRFLLHRIKQMNAGHPYKIILEGIGFNSNNNYHGLVQPNFHLLHFNEEMLNPEYVPATVLVSIANDASTQKLTLPPLNAKDRLLKYARQKVADDHWLWRLIFRVHLAFPRLSILSRRVARRAMFFMQQVDQASRVSGVYSDKLKHSALDFRYNYADIEDYFKDVLPEGNNLTQFERFAKMIGTSDHM